MKTIQSDGLILCAYAGGSLAGRGGVGRSSAAVGKILFAIELVSGQLCYVYDNGTRSVVLLKATVGQPLNDNRWHEVALVVTQRKDVTGGAAVVTELHTLHVDNSTKTQSTERSRDVPSQFGVALELFVGGLTAGLYHSLPKQVRQDLVNCSMLLERGRGSQQLCRVQKPPWSHATMRRGSMAPWWLLNQFLDRAERQAKIA